MKTVLLIDDDKTLMDSVSRALMSHGFDVMTSMNLREARRLAYLADIVVSDWDLGLYDILTGDQIVEELRKEFPKPRYIIWSGLHRQVPEGVDFFLKGDILGFIEALGDA